MFIYVFKRDTISGEPMALLSSALLRLNDVELHLDLPETPTAAAPTATPSAAPGTAPVLQRDFVPREEVETYPWENPGKSMTMVDSAIDF